MRAVGVSTGSYHGLGVKTEDALDRVHELDADLVEIYIQGAAELEPQVVGDITTRVQSNRTDVLAVHPYVFGWENLLFGSYERQRIWARRHFEDYLRVCADTGAEAYVSHGPPAHHVVRADGTFEPHYVATTRDLVSQAAGLGVRYCLENVSYGLLRTPADLLRHQEAIPELAYVVDFKSAWKAGFAPVDFLTPASVGSVHHTHVSFRDGGRYGQAARDEQSGLDDPDVRAALSVDVPHVLEIEATDADQVATSLAAVRAAFGAETRL